MTPQLVDANGLRFAYLAAGAGPLVLLAHGFPDTAYTWRDVLPALADAGYRAVAPFTRGYAPTQLPADGDYTVATLGRDLLALIHALAGGDRAILVGHDWGAAAAYCAAALEPAALQLLVTLAIPHPGALSPSPKLAWNLRHFVYLRRKGAAERIARADLRYVDTLVQRWSPGWDVPAGETDAVKAGFREPGRLDAALGYYRAFSPLDPTPAPLRERITVPTVAFAGESDLMPPRAFERVRHQFAGPYQVVQVPGGHFMHREHPTHFIRELLGVLADRRARDTLR